MKLEGSLDAFSLPDIFALLSMTKKTGGLHLRRPSAHGVVWFTTGSLTGGTSDVDRQTLARRLVGAGQVTDEALAAAVAAVRDDPDLGVARALLQAGSVEEAVLHDLVGEQVTDSVFDLLRWPDGEFAFALDEPNPDDVGVSMSVDEVVAEARRRLDSWGGVAAAVPSSQTVLSLATSLGEDPQLGRDDWALLALVDGRRTVGELVGVLGRGEYAVVSRLADLVGRGLLRAEADDGVATLLRRQALLAELEGGADVALPTAGDDESDDESDGDDLAEDVEVAGEPLEAERYPTVSRSQPAAAGRPVRRPSAPEAPAVPAQGSDRRLVTPTRTEPFLPKRQPEHAEAPVGGTSPDGAPLAAMGGSAVPAPNPATYIERDPSVNKSLLLRLIAGVRGL